MPRGKSIACREDKITSNSSSSDADNHELLGANQEQASTHNTGSSIECDAIISRGVPS
jgi:phage gpG-like protein